MDELGGLSGVSALQALPEAIPAVSWTPPPQSSTEQQRSSRGAAEEQHGVRAGEHGVASWHSFAAGCGLRTLPCRSVPPPPPLLSRLISPLLSHISPYLPPPPLQAARLHKAIVAAAWHVTVLRDSPAPSETPPVLASAAAPPKKRQRVKTGGQAAARKQQRAAGAGGPSSAASVEEASDDEEEPPLPVVHATFAAAAEEGTPAVSTAASPLTAP